MQRRVFIERACRAVAAAPLCSVAGLLDRPLAAQANPKALARIGITTVCFRDRFARTRPKDAPVPSGKPLTLLDAPQFIVDELGLHNVEVWNWHFDDDSIEYCRKLKAAAEAVGSRITNLQLDSPHDLSSADPASRADAIAFVKGWMDRAAALGAPHMRANPGGRRGDPVPDQTIDSFRQLAVHGQSINVKILVENHVGISVEIPKTVEIVRRVGSPFCRALADWGNTPSESPQARLDGLKEMFPYLEFVSAKQVDFDDQNKHISYDVVPLIKATEAAGYRGIYSIEMFGQHPPPDPVAAAKAMVQALADNIRP